MRRKQRVRVRALPKLGSASVCVDAIRLSIQRCGQPTGSVTGAALSRDRRIGCPGGPRRADPSSTTFAGQSNPSDSGGPPHAIEQAPEQMAGHWHDPTAATQNQGNQLGSRPCVRQSQLFRQNESGNTMKSLLGSSHLQWDTKHTQGAYDGRPAYDASAHFASTTSVAGRYHCARRRPTALTRRGASTPSPRHLENTQARTR